MKKVLFVFLITHLSATFLIYKPLTHMSPGLCTIYRAAFIPPFRNSFETFFFLPVCTNGSLRIHPEVRSRELSFQDMTSAEAHMMKG